MSESIVKLKFNNVASNNYIFIHIYDIISSMKIL